MYRIRCHVWGGVTGDRIDWLKNKDLSIWECADREEAQKKADEIVESIGHNPNANFSYTVIKV